MSTDEHEGEPGPAVAVDEADKPGEAGAEEAKRKLEIEVAITDAGPCKKHLRVSIARAEIDRQYNESLESLRKDAVVPGFRPGRAPRQLFVKRFKKQVSDQVKSSLLMSSLEQIDQEYRLDPISQPELDVAAIELPENGPMTFEMDVEVRPEFEVPQYRGFSLQRPVWPITEADIATQLRVFLEGHGQVVPKLEGSAELGDQLTADLVFLRPDGGILGEAKEQEFRLDPELRIQNGRIKNLGAALLGVKPGETRQAEAQMENTLSDSSLRGARIPVQVRVHDLKQFRLPELDTEFLGSIGYDSPDHLRQGVHEFLKRRLENAQRQALRRQIVDELLRQTPFELPKDLVTREEANTVRRLTLQLKQEGLTERQIRSREVEIRANAHESTLRSLKEFMLLAKIADAEKIQVGEEDLALEIQGLAEGADESPRRLRARLEKEGAINNLLTQVLERKVIDRILQSSTVVDVVVVPETIEDQGEILDYMLTPPTPSPSTAAGPGQADTPS